MHSSALSGLSIGCVPYLNARPLVWGIEEQVNFEIPSLLSDQFTAGCYDAALIPIFESLRSPHAGIVDNICIACLGEVHSVILVHKEPLDKIKEIVIDPASRTSTNLLRILLSEYFHLSPRLVMQSDDPAAAHLIIGDPAINFRNSVAGSGQRINILDLGQAWHNWTNLPFVFAVWTLRKDIPNALPIATAFRAVANVGLAARPTIASREPVPSQALAYLTRYIRYSLGDPEKEAIARFRDFLEKNNLLDSKLKTPAFL